MRRSNAVLEASMPPQRKAARGELCRHIPSAIAAAMVAKGVTATEIAARLGTTLANVSQIVNGERNLTLRTLADFAWALGMEPEELFASAEIARLTRELEEARGRVWVYQQAVEDIAETSQWPTDDREARRLMQSRARRALRATPQVATNPASNPVAKADPAVCTGEPVVKQELTPEPAPTVREALTVGQANVIWHELPIPVLMGYTGLPADGLDGAEFHGTDLDGAEASAPFAEILASVEAQRAWGYFDRPRGEIHAWIAADCELGFAVHFLAHELAHATGLDTPGPADVDDELRAELVGEIARHAYDLATARLAYLQANQPSSQPDPATRDRKGEAMHALVTGCPDIWADLDAEERAGWIRDAEDYEAMLRGGIAAVIVSPDEGEEEGDE